MYIAMNRFKVLKGSEADFETVWKTRDSRLKDVPGFVEFKLLRGPEDAAQGHVLYASHTVWRSHDDFVAWTRSEHFRQAHQNAGQTKVAYDGPPQFEGFNVVEGA